jgi:hypothetical protein
VFGGNRVVKFLTQTGEGASDARASADLMISTTPTECRVTVVGWRTPFG